jgi:hypothetical protein
MSETEIGMPERKMLSIEEMWSTDKGDGKNWGIDGYEVPKKYFDHAQSEWLKKRQDILNKHERKWPPPDWPKDKETDKQVPPKRPNYLDQVYKWSNSFYDAEKAKAVIERMAEHNRAIDKQPEPKKTIDKRAEFLKEEKKKEEWLKQRPEVPEFKQEAIDKVKEKIAQWEKDNKNKPSGKIKSMKGSMPTCDRVTVVAEAEHVGEKYPFYNTYKKEGEDENQVSNEDGKKKKKKKELFFPDVKLFLTFKSP